ncbi:hypothetical protein FHS23_004614 [Prauserella isguenensis]|uniref:Uncharacterized protein n=1 Tax=Prauserella isguenensis TaxID=1470180 RepID=A0A839S995_9PSEU|nr:hypothetical protein [Prauserella isguenensis]MBB3053560.1 hypothetical protein [Prauserella isguenensis]
MHPQRHELSIEPYSPALSAAADRITGMRERITTTAGSLREDGTRRTQVGAIAGVVLAAAAAVAAAIALGDVLGSGVAWLFGVVADGAAGFWDQVLYPAAVMPITLWFDLHAPAAGFDPLVMLLCWAAAGAGLWIASSTAHRLGLVCLVLWLGWAAATTALAYGGADPAAPALAAGTTGAALALLTMIGLVQLPTPQSRVRRDDEAELRTRMDRQQALLHAAVAADAPNGELVRLRRQLTETVERLTPGSRAWIEWRSALGHQCDREVVAFQVIASSAAVAAALLLLGATGSAVFAVLAVIAAGWGALAMATADYDERHAQTVLRRRDLALVD